MKTTVENESPTRRKLTIEVEPKELAPHVDQAIRKIASEVKIPGFRKGKVPRAVLETRLGKEVVQDEIFRDALPALYSEAASQESLRPVTNPQLDLTSYEEGSNLVFTATVDVRPEIEIDSYNVAVDRPPATVSDEEVRAQVDRLRDRFGTLEQVGRDAADGDYLTIDLRAYKHDEEIEGATAEDLLYELGSGTVVEELDKELSGKRPGDILKFNATLPNTFPGPHGGQEVTFQVIVKDVQVKNLPALDDEFAKTSSEFDTLKELEDDLRERIGSVKKIESEVGVRNRLIDRYLEIVHVDVPETLVARETEHRLSHLIKELEQAGLTVEDYLEANSSTQEQLVEAYRQTAERTIAADLLLETVAEKEEIKVEQGDLEEEFASLARRTGRSVEEVVTEVVEGGRVNVLAGDILRRKALEFLVEKAEINQEPADTGTDGQE